MAHQNRPVFVLVLASCVVTATLTVTLTMLVEGRGGVAAVASAADAQTLVPPCPQTGYGADGNMGPEFCMVENPIALRYFAPMAPQTFALGPNASPWEVTGAIVADSRRQKLGLPMLCSIYQLAAWKNHWSSGVSIVAAVGQALGAPPGWCSEPSFSGG